MSQKLYYVISDNGDGSNGIDWVTDDAVIDFMEQLVEEGNERYSSGDGLQVRELAFPDEFDLTAWLKTNRIALTTMDDFKHIRR